MRRGHCLYARQAVENRARMQYVATVGVVVGTVSGKRMLRRIPEDTFRLIVSGIILVLGIWMLIYPTA
jgi:uncharacterized membrane protein YfcA